MGSALRLSVVGASAGAAEEAWAAASDRIEEIEQSLSRFRPTSSLMTLNRLAGAADAGPVDADLYRALAAADRAARITAGAFDPRVLVDLERLGYVGAPLDEPRGGALEGDATVDADPDRADDAPLDDSPDDALDERAPSPAPQARRQLLAFPDGCWLHRDPRTRSATVAAPLDLGGIGKGLALRWAFRAADRALGGLGPAVGALLEAGGDLIARGLAPQSGPWLVGIESPLVDGLEIAILAVGDGAVATSSVAVHSWRTGDGRPVHHLVDPISGEPGGEGLLSVTVAGPDPAWSEVWSKTLFLLGPRDIGQRARAAGLAAWWVDVDGHLEMTPAARQRTVWQG